MAWTTPKTDWVPTDYFNIEDYNRMIGNIAHLKSLADELFYGFPSIADMGSEKLYASPIYAREINVIEANLDNVCKNSYGFDIGNPTTYQANRNTISWSEFNRIESACLLLYNTLVSHKNALPRLAFTLGGQKGIRV